MYIFSTGRESGGVRGREHVGTPLSCRDLHARLAGTCTAGSFVALKRRKKKNAKIAENDNLFQSSATKHFTHCHDAEPPGFHETQQAAVIFYLFFFCGSVAVYNHNFESHSAPYCTGVCSYQSFNKLSWWLESTCSAVVQGRFATIS